jgi:hypothetical protein
LFMAASYQELLIYWIQKKTNSTSTLHDPT